MKKLFIAAVLFIGGLVTSQSVNAQSSLPKEYHQIRNVPPAVRQALNDFIASALMEFPDLEVSPITWYMNNGTFYGKVRFALDEASITWILAISPQGEIIWGEN